MNHASVLPNIITKKSRRILTHAKRVEGILTRDYVNYVQKTDVNIYKSIMGFLSDPKLPDQSKNHTLKGALRQKQPLTAASNRNSHLEISLLVFSNYNYDSH